MIKKGFVTREEVFLTTKVSKSDTICLILHVKYILIHVIHMQLWNNQHEEAKVVPALEESLKKLGLSYVDLYLIHWPLATNVR